MPSPKFSFRDLQFRFGNSYSGFGNFVSGTLLSFRELYFRFGNSTFVSGSFGNSTFVSGTPLSIRVRQHGKVHLSASVDTIIHDEEMISRWDVLMAEVECNEGNMLLKMLVELYITIRGFSFAKTLVEEYKQFTKKTTQKSKALRKTVANDKEE